MNKVAQNKIFTVISGGYKLPQFKCFNNKAIIGSWRIYNKNKLFDKNKIILFTFFIFVDILFEK